MLGKGFGFATFEHKSRLKTKFRIVKYASEFPNVDKTPDSETFQCC
jgi:hypothetical protein